MKLQNPNAPKDTLTLVKVSIDSLKYLAQLVPVAIILSCIILWLYLRGIDRLDLFPSSLKNPNNSIGVLLAFLHLMVSLVLPSIPLLSVLYCKGDNSSSTQKYITVLLSSFAIIFICSLLLFFTIPFTIHASAIPIIIPFTIVATITIIFYSLNFSKEFLHKRIIIILSILLSLYLFPGSITTLLQILDGHSVKALAYIIFRSLFFSLFIYLPVFYFLIRKMNNENPLGNSMLLALPFIPLLSILFFNNLMTVTLSKLMSEAGITNWYCYTYRIDSHKYSPAEFQENRWNTKRITNDHFLITASNPFTLDNKTLLCPGYLTAAYINSTIVNIDIPENKRRENKNIANRLFQHCFVFDNNYIDRNETATLSDFDVKNLATGNQCL